MGPRRANIEHHKANIEHHNIEYNDDNDKSNDRNYNNNNINDDKEDPAYAPIALHAIDASSAARC